MSRPVYLRSIGDRLLFAQRRASSGLWIVACIVGCAVIGFCLSRSI